MSISTILGLVGDTLTFTGGFILAWDALSRGVEFNKTTNLQKAVAQLAGIDLTQDGLRLFNEHSVELLFIRRSVRRAKWGTVIVTLGFFSLLTARIIEVAN